MLGCYLGNQKYPKFAFPPAKFPLGKEHPVSLVQWKKADPRVDCIWPSLSVSSAESVCCRCGDSLSLDDGAYWLFTVLTRVCLPLQACLAC